MNDAYIKYQDEQLVQLMHEGDLDAFSMIFHRYNEPLLNFSLKIIQNKEDAADIIQEIFVSLWNRRSDIVFSHSLQAWLYQAVRFQAARYIHQSKRKRAFLAELVALMPQVEARSPDATLVQEQLDAALRATIETMPARMKEVFVLSREYQLSHREISRKLKIAESTVKKTVQNALRFIREKSITDFIFLIIFLIFF